MTKIAKDRADWLLDAVAVSTQNRQFLRGDPEYDAVAGESILLNAEKAIEVATARLTAVLDKARAELAEITEDAEVWCSRVGNDSSWDSWDSNYKKMQWTTVPKARAVLAEINKAMEQPK